ncbi:MAG: hypothetical protein M3010_07850 [Candidatus Dormibacteraeota bacterium]|nr:hypothetical protein [Candidatus Dormibacteraeota bacterium]
MAERSRHIIHGSSVYLRGAEPADAQLYSRWRSDVRPMSMSDFGFRGPLGIAAARS